jgi:hypothetical protein
MQVLHTSRGALGVYRFQSGIESMALLPSLGMALKSVSSGGVCFEQRFFNKVCYVAGPQHCCDSSATALSVTELLKVL